MNKYFILILAVLLLSACKSPPAVVQSVEEKVQESVAEIIEVKEPAFEIISIAIIQADLVNTLFEAVLKIDNPNKFPVELSSMKYELFGNGMLWAEGAEKDIFHVDALSTLETKFLFSMNFIDMNRKLLDDVITMRQIQYHFKGTALMRAIIPSAQVFTVNYDCSGLSEVKQDLN